MNRRAFLSALGGSLLAASLAAEAQQAGKVYRVGILTNKASDPAEARLWQAVRSGLRERGWIEGQNILIEFRAAEGNTARLPELAADLVRLKVDLIVARASIFVQPAKEATSSIPIVFPLSNCASTSRSCTHVKTARWVSRSIRRRVREIVE